MSNPIKGNTSCVASSCNTIIAYVDCTLVVLQGATGCIDIQLLNSDSEPLDLSEVIDLKILLFNEFECNVAQFFWPSIPSGCTGNIITILQETNSAGDVINQGLIRICLSSEQTTTSPSFIFGEIMITLDTTQTGETGSTEVIGIPAIEVARILKSRILNSSCESNLVTGSE